MQPTTPKVAAKKMVARIMAFAMEEEDTHGRTSKFPFRAQFSFSQFLSGLLETKNVLRPLWVLVGDGCVSFFPCCVSFYPANIHLVSEPLATEAASREQKRIHDRMLLLYRVLKAVCKTLVWAVEIYRDKIGLEG